MRLQWWLQPSHLGARTWQQRTEQGLYASGRPSLWQLMMLALRCCSQGRPSPAYPGMSVLTKSCEPCPFLEYMHSMP